MYVMLVNKHSPESCPLFHRENRKTFRAVMDGFPQVLDKHGLKLVGSWSNFGLHTMYMVFEAPSMDAWMAVVNEPQSAPALAFMTAEFFPVMSWEEASAYMDAQ